MSLVPLRERFWGAGCELGCEEDSRGRLPGVGGQILPVLTSSAAEVAGHSGPEEQLPAGRTVGTEQAVELAPIAA